MPQLGQVPLAGQARPRKVLEGIMEKMKAPKVGTPVAPRLQPQVLPRVPAVAPRPIPRPPAIPKVGIALPKLHRIVPRAPLFPRAPAGPPPPPVAAAAAAAPRAAAMLPKAPTGPNVTQSPFFRLLKPTRKPVEPQEPAPELPAPITPRPGVDRGPLLQRIEQEITSVMQINSKAKSEDKKKLGKRLEFPVESVAVGAMSEMSGLENGMIILRNIKDAITGKIVVPECQVKHARVLGVGGMGVVDAVVVVADDAAQALGATELAIKLTYAEVPREERSPKLQQVLVRGLRELVIQETEPLKVAAKKTGGKMSALDITERFQWALPVYEGTLGVQEEPLYFKDDFAFLNDIVVSKVMMGDGSILEYRSRTGQEISRLSTEAKERVCQELIASTAALHAQRLVHYDIKPENILIGANGKTYLADFGMTGPRGERRYCMSKLTPAYMDPAQASCARAQGNLPLSPKYDSWSVGMTCYGIMTDSRMPYGITPTDKIVETLSDLDPSKRRGAGAPKPLPHPEADLRRRGISGFWSKVVAAMLDRNRDSRPSPEDIVNKYTFWPLGEEGNE